MQIILISIGTRGDIEPFVAMGELLKKKGHNVTCAFPEQFRTFTERTGLSFFSLGTSFTELLNGDKAKTVLGGGSSFFGKIKTYIELAKDSKKVGRELFAKQYELIENQNPDRILYSGKVLYPIFWGIENKGKTFLVCPVPYMHYVKGHPHVAFNRNLGDFLNRFTFSLVNFGLIVTTKAALKKLNLSKNYSYQQLKNEISTSKVIYSLSPSLFPKPIYWKDNLKVLGYRERTNTARWIPEKELVDFIKKHNKILFVTFGSMTNSKPKEKTKMIRSILKKHNIAAIINTADGGLLELENSDVNLLYYTSSVPYSWIFPKVYAVVHHGGTGTTHAALKHGCAMMIIPHIMDQFVWNKVVYNKGFGPKGIKIDKMNAKNLEPKILDLFNNASYKQRAEQLSLEIAKEDFKDELYHFIMESPQ